MKEQLNQVSERLFEREQQTRDQVVNNLIRIERLENPTRMKKKKMKMELHNWIMKMIKK